VVDLIQQLIFVKEISNYDKLNYKSNHQVLFRNKKPIYYFLEVEKLDEDEVLVVVVLIRIWVVKHFSFYLWTKNFFLDFSARGGSKAASSKSFFSFSFIYLILLYLVASLKLNDSDDGLRTSASRRSSTRKRTSGLKDSTDSVCKFKFQNLIYLLYKNRTLKVFHHHLFYVNRYQRILFHINLVIIPHLIMINKVLLK